MTAEYNADGYTDIRTYVYNAHNWIGIYDNSDTPQELLRWNVQTNSNITDVSGPSTNPIEYEITITGSDIENAGFTLPVTIESVKLYESETASAAFATDTLEDNSGVTTTATFEASTDEATITFTNEWPQQ